MTHPLTDEKLKKLFWDYAVNTGWDECDWTSDGMRTAYDKGVEACIDWLLNYPWRAMSVQGIAEDMEEQLLAHKCVLQSDQPNKED